MYKSLSIIILSSTLLGCRAQLDKNENPDLPIVKCSNVIHAEVDQALHRLENEAYFSLDTANISLFFDIWVNENAELDSLKLSTIQGISLPEDELESELKKINYSCLSTIKFLKASKGLRFPHYWTGSKALR